MAVSWAVVVCTIHMQADQGVLMVDENTQALSWNACCGTTAALDGYGLRSAGGEVVDTDENGLGGCWG
jgi:hypothetical protein